MSAANVEEQVGLPAKKPRVASAGRRAKAPDNPDLSREWDELVEKMGGEDNMVTLDQFVKKQMEDEDSLKSKIEKLEDAKTKLQMPTKFEGLCKEVFGLMDTNGDGKFGKEEGIKMMMAIEGKTTVTEEEKKEAEPIWDAFVKELGGEDGVVTLDQFVKKQMEDEDSLELDGLENMKKLLQMPTKFEGLCKEVFGLMDTNGDGKFGKEEGIKLLMAMSS